MQTSANHHRWTVQVSSIRMIYTCIVCGGILLTRSKIHSSLVHVTTSAYYIHLAGKLRARMRNSKPASGIASYCWSAQFPYSTKVRQAAEYLNCMHGLYTDYIRRNKLCGVPTRSCRCCFSVAAAGQRVILLCKRSMGR